MDFYCLRSVTTECVNAYHDWLNDCCGMTKIMPNFCDLDGHIEWLYWFYSKC